MYVYNKQPSISFSSVMLKVKGKCGIYKYHYKSNALGFSHATNAKEKLISFFNNLTCDCLTSFLMMYEAPAEIIGRELPRPI